MKNVSVTLMMVSRMAVVLTGLLLVGYIGYLVVAQYRSQVALHESALKQLNYDSERRAIAISYFFQEREGDLQEIAESRQLSAYFENKALGMSMEYGLRASLLMIDDLFDRMRRKKELDGQAMFSRIALVDSAGHLLNDTRPPGLQEEVQREWRAFLTPAGHKPSIIIDEIAKEPTIIVTFPCYDKELYVGQVIGWISPALVHSYFIEGATATSRYPVAIIFNKEFLFVPKQARKFIPANLRAIPGDISPGHPYRFNISGIGTGSSDGYTLLLPIVNTPMSLLTFIPPEERIDFHSPGLLLSTTGGLAVFILAGMFFLLRVNLRNEVLGAHLKETIIREKEVAEKNRLLADEVQERRIAEASLQRERDFVECLFETAQVIMLVLDNEGRIVRFNHYMEEIAGYSLTEMRGKDWFVHFLPEEEQSRQRDMFLRAVLDDRPNGMVFPIVTRDGRRREIEWHDKPLRGRDNFQIGLLFIGQDITERKKLEAELLKAEKLESLGVLAGGIAHDFNNLLTSIMGNVSIAKLMTRTTNEVYLHLSDCENACLRAVDLTRQLLTFSKGGTPIREASSIIDIVRESAGFALHGSNVRCDFYIPDHVWPVEVDAGQISQVIHNLCINAYQAMPEGGIIRVSCENAVIGPEEALPLKEGRYVKITISDQGVGIPEENLQKIFDPYFTTKQKGSGLGLASSFSIVKKHEGFITVESEQGKGAMFHIYLPASRKALVPETESREELLAGTGRILVMDDEEIVRNIIDVMLGKLGYESEFAQDGAEAIDRYSAAKAAGRPFDAVIMDLTIPGGMGGKETIKKLQEIDPHVKAIVSSGYSNDPVMANFRDCGFKGVVTKPYTLEEINGLLRRVLTEVS